MHYIHNLDPVIFHVWGPLAIRWYGLAYLVGFVGGYFILNRWGRRNLYPLNGEALQSFMIAIVIGLMLGGRIGFVLFYDLSNFLRDPALIFRIWEGGMSSHGGMIGLTLATIYESRRRNVSFFQLADGLAAVAPIGLGLGRIANFINGELWGRVTNVPWAVVFPHEAGITPQAFGSKAVIDTYIENGLLMPRHPSQLYQAGLEGIFLLVALMLVYPRPWARAGAGRVSGLFLALYALVRFITEFFREPEIVHFGWLTQGQLLSVTLMLPGAAYLIGRTYWRKT